MDMFLLEFIYTWGMGLNRHHESHARDNNYLHIAIH